MGSRASAGLRGAVGGFGAVSDLTWNAAGFLGCDFELFGRASTFFVGYRDLYRDYSTASGLKKFALDTTLYGPVLGLGFSF